MLQMLSCLTLLVSSATTAGSDWPTYMADPTRVGRTDQNPPKQLSPRWSWTSYGAPRTAWPGPGGRTIENLELEHRVRFDDAVQPIIADGMVYFGSSVDHCVRCLDLVTGAEKWRHPAGGAVRLAPTYAEGRVYFGADDGWVKCLDARSGQLLWKMRAGPRDEFVLARGSLTSRWPVRTGVLVRDGVAYFGAGVFPHETIYLYAVDAKSGDVIWCNDRISETNAGRNDLSPQGYLLASEDTLFVPSNRTLPAAFDLATGDFRHKQQGGGKQIGGSQALLVDDTLYSVGEHTLLILGQKKGDILGKLAGRQMTYSGNRAYVASEGTIVAIDRAAQADSQKKGHERFVRAAALREELKAHALHGLVKRRAALTKAISNTSDPGERSAKQAEASQLDPLIQTARSAHEALRAELNEVVGIDWSVPCPLESILVLAGDTLVAGGPERVQLLGVQDGREIASAQLPGEVRGLAVAGGFLLASTTDGTVTCLGPADSAAKTAAAPDAHAYIALNARDFARARERVRRSGIERGYALVLGAGDGAMVRALLETTELRIHCIEPHLGKAATLRAAMVEDELYGTRVTIAARKFVDEIPSLPSYFANLVVHDGVFDDRSRDLDPRAVARLVKPHGGVVLLEPADAEGAAATERWIAAMGLGEQSAVRRDGHTFRLERGRLPDTADWTHQYGTPSATCSIDDRRVRGGMRVLWYGDPGPSVMQNRHDGAVGPLSAGGRLFIQGFETISAYDAYNGVFLWKYDNPGALRTGVFNNHEPGNLAFGDGRLFTVERGVCLELDAATGAVLRTWKAPEAGEGAEWGWLAYVDGLLCGTATRRDLLPPNKRGRGRLSNSSSSDLVFAYDLDAGTLKWRYEGDRVAHTTVAIADGRLHFVDASMSTEERTEWLAQDKAQLAQLSGDEQVEAEERLKRVDLRRAIALDLTTGEVLWDRAVDVTDCTGVGIGSGLLTVMVDEGKVVLCGANANGHYWNQFLKGEFSRRRVVVLDADSGDVVWKRDCNYRHRPLIVSGRLVAEPWAFDLHTGEVITRTHPLTGSESPWKFTRPGHHCGAIAASTSMMFYRSKFSAYYDLEEDSGTRHFAGQRLGCWVNMIPAGGLVLMPESSAGCACLFSVTCTVVFEPQDVEEVWGMYSAEGASVPVRDLALNLGGPGDRRDESGRLWLAWPRPPTRTGLDISLSVKTKFASGFGFELPQEERDAPSNALAAWMLDSGAAGLRELRVPLRGPDDGAAKYSAKVHLVSTPEAAGTWSLTIEGAGKPSTLQIPEHGARVHLVEVDSVEIAGELVLSLRPEDPADEGSLHVAGLEVLRDGATPVLRARGAWERAR